MISEARQTEQVDNASQRLTRLTWSSHRIFEVSYEAGSIRFFYNKPVSIPDIPGSRKGSCPGQPRTGQDSRDQPFV
jgi:hypothetical protein